MTLYHLCILEAIFHNLGPTHRVNWTLVGRQDLRCSCSFSCMLRGQLSALGSLYGALCDAASVPCDKLAEPQTAIIQMIRVQVLALTRDHNGSIYQALLLPRL